MSGKLEIVREGATETWVLNDPATRNALSDDMVQALQAACERAVQDPSLRFVVLGGAGDAFCAGGSLGSFGQAVGQALPPGVSDPLVGLNRRFGALLQSLCGLPQVLVAVVNGPAMGGGLGLVCCADFVLAGYRAVLAAPEVTLGIAPAQIAPFVLKRLGDRAARQCLLTGRKWTAWEALQLGLVDEVHAADELPAALQALLARLGQAGPRALAATKELLAASQDHGLPAVLDRAATLFAGGLRGAEAAEGLQAFSRKAQPGWAA